MFLVQTELAVEEPGWVFGCCSASPYLSSSRIDGSFPAASPMAHSWKLFEIWIFSTQEMLLRTMEHASATAATTKPVLAVTFAIVVFFFSYKIVSHKSMV